MLKHRFPPLHLARAILLRAVVIWLGLKIVVTGLSIAVQGPVDHPYLEALHLTLWPMFLLVALVAWLSIHDMRRRHEILFLANLGVDMWALIGLVALPALAFEIVLGAL